MDHPTIKKERVLIHNWGVNDSKSPVRIRNPKWVCPIYSTWVRMIERCHSEREQKRKPTYKGCTIIDEWKYFSKFRAWMITQDWEGNQLDKDLLVKGNKVYSADTCLFVSRQVNSFMTKADAKRGDLPLGVTMRWDDKKFVAQCCGLDGKQQYIGSYDSSQAAEKAYYKRKFEMAEKLASSQPDNVRDAILKHFEVKEH